MSTSTILEFLFRYSFPKAFVGQCLLLSHLVNDNEGPEADESHPDGTVELTHPGLRGMTLLGGQERHQPQRGVCLMVTLLDHTSQVINMYFIILTVPANN